MQLQLLERWDTGQADQARSKVLQLVEAQINNLQLQEALQGHEQLAHLVVTQAELLQVGQGW
jgi:hypothetical protein